MPETQNIRNDNAHEQGIRFLSLLNLMTLIHSKEKTEAAQQIDLLPLERLTAAAIPGWSFPGLDENFCLLDGQSMADPEQGAQVAMKQRRAARKERNHLCEFVLTTTKSNGPETR